MIKKLFISLCPFTMLLFLTGASIVFYITYIPELPDLPHIPTINFTLGAPLDRQKDLHQAISINLLRDPFLRSITSIDTKESKKIDEIYLTLVVIKDNDRLCRISGGLYREGETVSGLRIKKITKHGVWFEHRKKGLFFVRTGEGKAIE